MIIDTDMRYDNDTKRFYLTENYVYNKLGIDLSIVAFDETDTNLSTLNERIIEYACDILHDYIEEYAVNTKCTQYYLATNKDANLALKRALGYQLSEFVLKGESTTEKDADRNASVSKRAIKALDAKDVFYVIYSQIPEEW